MRGEAGGEKDGAPGVRVDKEGGAGNGVVPSVGVGWGEGVEASVPS